MMPSAKSLDYQVTLLLTKHGKGAVLKVLAKKLKLTTDELEDVLKKAVEKKSVARAHRSSPDGLANKGQFLRKLRGHFRNGLFLPGLDDIKSFFEEHGRSLTEVQTREEAATKLFRLLGKLPVSELEAICNAKP